MTAPRRNGNDLPPRQLHHRARIPADLHPMDC
jgi:hypothetical protein